MHDEKRVMGSYFTVFKGPQEFGPNGLSHSPHAVCSCIHTPEDFDLTSSLQLNTVNGTNHFYKWQHNGSRRNEEDSSSYPEVYWQAEGQARHAQLNPPPEPWQSQTHDKSSNPLRCAVLGQCSRESIDLKHTLTPHWVCR